VGRAGSAGRNPQAGASVSAALGRMPVVARSGCRLPLLAVGPLWQGAVAGWWWRPRQGAAGGARSPDARSPSWQGGAGGGRRGKELLVVP
jgi:hypothetical protein